MKSEFQIEDIRPAGMELCLVYLVKAKSWLKRMEPGQILELLGTDSEALKNFPSILRNGDDRIVEVKQYPEHHRLLIRRG